MLSGEVKSRAAKTTGTIAELRNGRDRRENWEERSEKKARGTSAERILNNTRGKR